MFLVMTARQRETSVSSSFLKKSNDIHPITNYILILSRGQSNLFQMLMHSPFCNVSYRW